MTVILLVGASFIPFISLTVMTSCSCEKNHFSLRNYFIISQITVEVEPSERNFTTYMSLQMSFRLEVVKAKEKPNLLIYSFSPNDLLKEVVMMTKHLKSKCEVVLERNRNRRRSFLVQYKFDVPNDDT